MIYLTKQNDMIDALCHRYYGVTEGTTEALLLANPGLADRQVPLPAGVEITLPELPKPTKTIKTVKLWD